MLLFSFVFRRFSFCDMFFWKICVSYTDDYIVDLKIFGRCDEFMWLSFHQASERLTLAGAEPPTAQGQLALCTACSQRSQTRAKVS